MTNGAITYSQTVTTEFGIIQQALAQMGTWQVTITDGTHTSNVETVVVTRDQVY